jgi:rhamnose transport system ATP-binding protein
MDEPTASLTSSEVQRLFATIDRLRQKGVGIIYISHRLEEIAELADRVTVLRDGRTVTTLLRDELPSADLPRLMVGRELSRIFPKRRVPLGEAALEVRGLSSRAAGVESVSFSVRTGEILGIAGLVGSGRTELAMTLFGLLPSDSGEIIVGGRRERIASPREAIERQLAYVPEDRRRHGVIPEMSLAANISLPDLDAVSRTYLIDSDAEHELAERFVSRLRVKTSSVDANVETLSGGNQQKVAVARWLATGPKVLILDEPTQGVDVGAKAEIHELMGELAARGVAIVMISSELPELVGMSDRIAVMRHGAIVGELPAAESTESKILALALGVA